MPPIMDDFSDPRPSFFPSGAPQPQFVSHLEPPMDGNFQFLDLIFLALVAGFLVYRLRNVLGRRDGYEQKPEEMSGRKPAEDNVVDLTKVRQGGAEDIVETGAVSDRGVAAGLVQIQTADPNFDPDAFLGGAKAAFEMIVAAFAEGRVEDIKPYLGAEVYANFAAAVRDREAAGEKVETQVVSIKKTTITEAAMKGRDAVVSVEFVTEQVNVVRDAEDRVVDGDPNAVVVLTDVWTFSRDVRASDPNWKLMVTRSVEP